MHGDKPLRVRWLGTVDYAECWDLQQGLFEGEQDHLLLCEHPPTYTLGVRGEEKNVLVDPATVGATTPPGEPWRRCDVSRPRAARRLPGSFGGWQTRRWHGRHGRLRRHGRAGHHRCGRRVRGGGRSARPVPGGMGRAPRRAAEEARGDRGAADTGPNDARLRAQCRPGSWLVRPHRAVRHSRSGGHVARSGGRHCDDGGSRRAGGRDGRAASCPRPVDRPQRCDETSGGNGPRTVHPRRWSRRANPAGALRPAAPAPAPAWPMPVCPFGYEVASPRRGSTMGSTSRPGNRNGCGSNCAPIPATWS